MIRNLAAASLLLALPTVSHAATAIVPISFDIQGGGNVEGSLLFFDEQSTTVSGTIQANVTIDITDPGAPFVTTIEFLGGAMISFTDVTLNVGTLGTIDTNFVKGSFTGAASVSGGSIAAGAVGIDVGLGTADASFTTTTNPDIDFSNTPLSGFVSAGGSISLSNVGLSGGDLTFDANLSLPVDISQTFPVTSDEGQQIGIGVGFSGTITGSASGTSVAIPIPEPGSAMLLMAALGAFGWLRRR